VGMANVLNEEKKQQVLAPGRLGWLLRRIQQTGIRRETAGAYLKAAGIAVRQPTVTRNSSGGTRQELWSCKGAVSVLRLRL
jgi:glucose-6-phosphate dehydrogenase assembly protein OpcA